MLTDDIVIKKADGAEVYIRNIAPGDEILTHDGGSQLVKDNIAAGYMDTYAIIASFNKTKKCLYATLDTELMDSNDNSISAGQLSINVDLKDSGKILGVALSGERKVYKLIVDKPFIANGFVVFP